MLSDKRRVLRDEESKLHEIERKIREKQYHEKTIAERLKIEYDDLRSRFEQMAFELRFSIEDELKIYARLLDELIKKSSIATSGTAAITSSSGTTGGSASTVTYSTISSRIRSGGIEDQEGGSSNFHQTRTMSSSGAAGNSIFDLGNATSSWQDLGGGATTTSVGAREYLEAGSVTRSSSYSNLD